MSLDQASLTSYRSKFQDAIKHFGQVAARLAEQHPPQKMQRADVGDFILSNEKAFELMMDEVMSKYAKIEGSSTSQYRNDNSTWMGRNSLQTITMSNLRHFLIVAFETYLEKKLNIEIEKQSTPAFRFTLDQTHQELIRQTRKIFDGTSSPEYGTRESQRNQVKAEAFVRSYIDEISRWAPGFSRAISSSQSISGAAA